MKTRYIAILATGIVAAAIIRFTLKRIQGLKEESWFQEQFAAIIDFNEMMDELNDQDEF